MKIVRKTKKAETKNVSDMSELEQKKRSLMKKKRKSRAKRRMIVFLFLLVCGAAIFAVLKAPVFNVKTVYCVGQSSLKEADILKLADVSTGKNIFSTNIRAVKKRLASNPEIAESNVRRIFPNKIKIWVKEAKTVAYIEKDGRKLLMDQNGQIIKILSGEEAKNLPKAARIEGIEIASEIPGEYIASSDDQRAAQLFECVGNLSTLDMLDKVNLINFENLSDIKIDYENRLFMMLGDYENLEYKLKFVKKVIGDNISEYEKAPFDYRGDKLYVGPRPDPEEDGKTEEGEGENPEANEENPGEQTSPEEKPENAETAQEQEPADE